MSSLTSLNSTNFYDRPVYTEMRVKHCDIGCHSLFNVVIITHLKIENIVMLHGCIVGNVVPVERNAARLQEQRGCRLFI